MALNMVEINSFDENDCNEGLVVPQDQSVTCSSLLQTTSLVKKDSVPKTETQNTNLVNCDLEQNNDCESKLCILGIQSSADKNSECEQLSEVKVESPSPSPPSKQSLCGTKRRAGLLYKQIKSSKVYGVSSEYFSQAHNTQKRWIPPRSPYALVQEDLFDNPWQLLVATIFLTKTAAKKALPHLHKFLARYPRPEDVLQASYEDIDEYFKPLGLTTTRSHIIMRFTVEYLEKDWTYPRELYGIGKYGDDSYRIFCVNEWRQVSPDDIPLTMYRNWLLENAHRLGIS